MTPIIKRPISNSSRVQRLVDRTGGRWPQKHLKEFRREEFRTGDGQFVRKSERERKKSERREPCGQS